MGKVGKFIIGAVLIVGGVVIGAVTGNWHIGLAMISAGVGVLTRPKIPTDLSKDQGAMLQTRIGAQNSLPVIYGTTQVAGVYVDVRVDANSTSRKRLFIVIAWCLGSRDGGGIQAIDEIWFDDRMAINGGAVQAPFSTVVPNELVGGLPIKHLEFRHYLGETVNATADPRLRALFSSAWPGSSVGQGIAYSVFEMWYNTDIYGSGIPSTIQAKIRGARVEDPRSRLWAFSNNPSLCIRDYLMSSVYGQGVAAGNLDVQDFIDMANFYDEVVSIPGASNGPRYTCDGWVDGARPVPENLARLATSARAMIVNEGDRWRITTRRARVPTGFVVDESNTVEGSWKYSLAGAEAPNVVRATYVDPAQKYQTDDVQWPAPGVANAYLVADNNFESRLEIDLPHTQSRARAQQMAMTILKEARLGTVVTVTLLESALTMRVGDLVAVTQPSPGWNNKLFDVLAMLLQNDGQIQAVLAEYDSTAYDLDAQSAPAAIPTTDLPNPFTVAAPTAMVLDGSSAAALVKPDGTYVARIYVTWAVPAHAFLEYVEVQARQRTSFLGIDADPVHVDMYEYLMFQEASAQQHDIASLGLAVGDQLSFEAEVWNTNAGANERVRMKFWDAAHALIGSAQDGNLVNATVPTLSGFSGVAIPANTVYISARGFTTDGTPSRMRIRNAILYKTLQPYDSWGRVSKESTPQFYIVPAAGGVWDVQIRSVNRLDVTSAWVVGAVRVSDRPPQIMTLTLAPSHVDTAHSDTAHQDTVHTDIAHTDAHVDTHSDTPHDNQAHMDGPDGHTNVGHVDSAHFDSHSDTHSDVSHGDTPHSDGHIDVGHGDGNYGVGVAVQADADAGSVKAVARKGGPNLLTNGGGEVGTVGAQATGWTAGAGNGLLVATDAFFYGTRSLKIDNTVGADSNNYQDVAVIVGRTYRIHGWIKTNAMPTADAGFGAVINIDTVSGVTGFTIVSKTTTGADPNAAQPDCGIAADGSVHAFTYVECVFQPTGANGTIRVYCQLGYGGNQSGIAWFDDVWLQDVYATTIVLPDIDDIRAQPSTDGRNVTFPLIDAATGGQLSFRPGEVAGIAGVAYSKVAGAGTEGPIGRAQQANFPVAPTGVDQWTPA